MKKIILLVSIISFLSCASKKNININNDYEIINKFLEKYTSPLFDEDVSTFYLEKSLNGKFEKKWLEVYKTYLNKFNYTDSLCKSGRFPEIDSLKKSMPCIMRDNYAKYNNVFNKDDIDYFGSENLQIDTEKLEHEKINVDEAILVRSFKKFEKNDKALKTLKIKGPFYNYSKNKALLEWFEGSTASSEISNNCFIFIKKDNIWYSVGNLSYGL